MKNTNRLTKVTSIVLTAAMASVMLPVAKATLRADTTAASQQTDYMDDSSLREFTNYYESANAFLSIHFSELPDDVRYALDGARTNAHFALVNKSGRAAACSDLRVQLEVAQATLANRAVDTNRAPDLVMGTAGANAAGMGTQFVSVNTANTVASIYRSVSDYNLPPQMARQQILGSFVDRIYMSILGRNCEASARDSIVNAMMDGTMTANDVVEQVLGSSEFTSKNLSDSAFVTVLYKAFTDRDPDAQGLNNWVNALGNGTTRAQVISSFELSNGWTGLCSYYGINN